MTKTPRGITYRAVCRNIACCLVALAVFAIQAGVPAQSVRVARETVKPGRVVLVSFDGLAYHIWSRDPVIRELRSLDRIAARGVVARGMIQAFPSVTPAGHAAIWTGAYGDVSGVVAADNPVLPRSEHTVAERRSGYNSESLRAEPLWVTAARQGLRVVAHQATQDYPFIPFVTAADAWPPPVLVSGYGPEMLTKHVMIAPSDVTNEDASGWVPSLPQSSLPVRTFRWTTGPVTFHGALVAERNRARGYTALFVAADRAGPRVRVAHHATENVPPRARSLARYFSEGLSLIAGERRAPTVAYFRLFELSRDGKDFLLYQPSLHELAMTEGSPQSQAALAAMLRETGGFIGNGPSYLYRDGSLGPQLFARGNGVAERRFLEGMELVIRQHNRLSEWLCDRYDPQLLIDYSNYPDEMEHSWYGLARPDVSGISANVVRRINEYRRWAYIAIDRRVELMDRLAGASGHLIIVSDHGMSPVVKEVNVPSALRAAGLTILDEKGRVDVARTKAVYLKYSVAVNTEDWRGGIVKRSQRQTVVDEVETALRAVRDPETNQPVFTAFFRPEQFGSELGIGGPAGGDLYFELAPGYEATTGNWNEVIRKAEAPTGEHGFLPTRPEMLASFIARGPRLPAGARIPTVRSIDVAPVAAMLLGIKPPAQSRGVVPIRLREVGR